MAEERGAAAEEAASLRERAERAEVEAASARSSEELAVVTKASALSELAEARESGGPLAAEEVLPVKESGLDVFKKVWCVVRTICCGEVLWRTCRGRSGLWCFLLPYCSALLQQCSAAAL